MYSGATQAAVKQLRAAEQAASQPRLPMPPPFDPMTLPPMQQATLMQMTISVVKSAAIRNLLEDSQDKPGTLDYRALCELGLAYRSAGKRYHDLTGDGREAAKTLEQILCRQFSIHLMIDCGQIGWEQKYSCPCGQWSTRVRRSTTSPGNARSRFNRHISTAEGMSMLVGALKPPVMAAEG